MTKILTSNGDGQIKVWEVNSGEVLHRFTGHKASVHSLALSPDGDLFASGSEDGAVKVWDLGSFVADDATGHGLEQQREVLREFLKFCFVCNLNPMLYINFLPPILCREHKLQCNLAWFAVERLFSSFFFT